MKGEADLVSISVTTDCAVDLLSRLEDEFFAEFSDQTPGRIIGDLYNIQCNLLGITDLDQPWHSAKRTTTQWLFKHFHDVLSSQARHMSIRADFMLPYSRPGSDVFGAVFGATIDWHYAKLCHDEHDALTELFQECWLLINFKKDLPVEDELLNKLRKMLKTRKVPISLAFSMSLLFDARKILGDHVEVPFKQMQLVGLHAKESVDASNKNRKDCQNESWPFQKDLVLQQNLMHIIDQWILKDGYNVMVKRNIAFLQYPQEDFRLLRKHPILCGLMAYSVQLTMQNIGLAYVNAWGSVMFVAHLYNAVRQEGVCEAEWTDMESFMNVHAAECLFRSGRPATPRDYFTRFELCMGAAADRYSRDKSHTLIDGFQQKQSGARLLKESTEVAKALRPRYNPHGSFKALADDKMTLTWNFQQVETILNARYRAASKNGGTWDEGLQSFLVEPRDYQQQKARKTNSNTKLLFPIEFLRALRLSVAEEVPLVTFDYFTFHNTCWSLLRTVEALCRTRILACLNRDYRENLDESRLPWIVWYLLRIEAKLQLEIGTKDPLVKLLDLDGNTRIILPYVGGVVCRILKGPHTKLTQEVEKVKGARLMFDPTLRTKTVVSTSVVRVPVGEKPPRGHPSINTWANPVTQNHNEYQEWYFQLLAAQSLEKLAGRPHKHFDTEGQRAEWFDKIVEADAPTKGLILVEAMELYAAEDEAFFGTCNKRVPRAIRGY